MLKPFKEKGLYYPFLIWIIVAFWYSIFVYNFFEATRYKTQDFFSSQAFYLFPRQLPETQKIIIVAIDEASRRHLNLKWPWRRSITAQLVRNIASFSPKVIGLDIIFSGRSQESEDKELISAFKEHPSIILGYKLGAKASELPLQSFIEATKAIGFINRPLVRSRVSRAEREIDKVIRNTMTFYIDRYGNKNYPLELEIIANYLDISPEEIRLDEDGVFLNDKLFIPSKGGIIPLNYLVHPNEFVTVSAYSVLEKKVNPSIFKDKIVLVGATDPLIHDEHLTPMGIFSGVSIVGNSLVMLLSRRFIYNLSLWQNSIIVLILGCLILLLNKRFAFGLSSILTFLILSAVFIGSLYLRSKDIQFDYFSVFFLSFTAYVVSNGYKYSYLGYMRNKLKSLAIKDPLTGFYNLRYFLLDLDRELEARSDSLAFLALLISNYRRLILDLNFEELKSLIKLLAEYTKNSLGKEFKKITFSRISQEMIGIAVWGVKKEEVEKFFKELLEELKKVEFKTETKAVGLSLQGILVYKPKGKRIQSKEIIYNVESLLKRLKEEMQDDFISLSLEEEKLWDRQRAPLREDILDFLTADLEERNKELERTLKGLQDSRKEIEEAYFEVILSLVKALEEKDTFTQGHSERVANYAKKIALQVGLDREEVELIYKAALLHDIGKIGLPDHLLHKKEKLTEEDMDLIRRHEIFSVEILKPIKAFKDLLPIILHHHEHFDGTGYPYGLSGDMIPRGAQILAVADAFDAITSGRGYKKGKSVTEAIEELERSKNQFNPLYIEALKKSLKL